MAGLRCGYGVGHPDSVAKMTPFRLATSVNQLALAAATNALGDKEFVERERTLNREARAYTRRVFEQLGYSVAPSEANFLFVDLRQDARFFREGCQRSGVLVGRAFPPSVHTRGFRLARWTRCSAPARSSRAFCAGRPPRRAASGVDVVPPAPQPQGPAGWVRFLDLLCLLIALAAMVVAMSGGFRLHFGDVRLAVTSPYRLLAVALALALVRQWAAPSTPVYRDLPRRLITWWQAPGVKPSAAVLVGTRPAVLFVGYLAVIMIGYPDGRVPQRLSQNELVNLPSRWDAGWYLGIVLSGYEFDSRHVDRQQNVVFFPAYPLIVRGVGRLLGGQTASYSGAGVIVSLVAFFGALIYLFNLARDMLDDDHAVAALWLLAAYPFALFYSAYYTESLYLLGVAGAFLHFTRRQVLDCGAVGPSRRLDATQRVLPVGAAGGSRGRAPSASRRCRRVPTGSTAAAVARGRCCGGGANPRHARVFDLCRRADRQSAGVADRTNRMGTEISGPRRSCR